MVNSWEAGLGYIIILEDLSFSRMLDVMVNVFSIAFHASFGW